jgi:hypothetical protein
LCFRGVRRRVRRGVSFRPCLGPGRVRGRVHGRRAGLRQVRGASRHTSLADVRCPLVTGAALLRGRQHVLGVAAARERRVFHSRVRNLVMRRHGEALFAFVQRGGALNTARCQVSFFAKNPPGLGDYEYPFPQPAFADPVPRDAQHRTHQRNRGASHRRVRFTRLVVWGYGTPRVPALFYRHVPVLTSGFLGVT